MNEDAITEVVMVTTFFEVKDRAAFVEWVADRPVDYKQKDVNDQTLFALYTDSRLTSPLSCFYSRETWLRATDLEISKDPVERALGAQMLNEGADERDFAEELASHLAPGAVAIALEVSAPHGLDLSTDAWIITDKGLLETYSFEEAMQLLALYCHGIDCTAKLPRGAY